MQPSLTIGVDFDRGGITGEIDGLEAVKQAVRLALETPRYRHLIFSWNYGNEAHSLIGKHRDLIRGELERYVVEALTQDDRITGIRDFALRFSEDAVLATFTVMSLYGEFTAERSEHLGI